MCRTGSTMVRRVNRRGEIRAISCAKPLARGERIVRLARMKTWVVSARSASGEETPVGLVEANGEAAALFRARTKVAQLFVGSSVRDVVVRPTRDERA
jgi:hypothetical protein